MGEPAVFVGFHPVRVRLAVGALGLAALAVLAWAAATVGPGAGFRPVFRASLAVGLLGGAAVVLARLRPRRGWGVTVGAQGLTISRPLSGDIRLQWSQVKSAVRGGVQAEALVVVLGDGRRVLVPRLLFASGRDFEAAARAVEDGWRARAAAQATGGRGEEASRG